MGLLTRAFERYLSVTWRLGLMGALSLSMCNRSLGMSLRSVDVGPITLHYLQRPSGPSTSPAPHPTRAIALHVSPAQQARSSLSSARLTPRSSATTPRRASGRSSGLRSKLSGQASGEHHTHPTKSPTATPTPIRPRTTLQDPNPFARAHLRVGEQEGDPNPQEG